MTEAWIIDACRTPRGIGKVGRGALTDIHPQRLGSTVLKALAERNNINTADVADIIWGCNVQRGPNGNDMGRMSALDAGYDIRSSGVTLDRFCGSGITTVNMAAASIMSGMEDMVIAGGCEMMSGYGAMANQISPFVDSGNTHLREMYGQSHQGLCADTIATIEGIPREDLDRLAEVSQQRAANAIEKGYFDKSLVPVYHDDGTLALAKDEFPRPETTMETLSQLKPSFEKLTHIPLDEEGTTYGKLMAVKYPEVKVEHVHHAGNSSGVVDGAAAVLLASPDYAT
jgi:acetyl-CoA C-acetyltransferase